jgi:hypothetical protein
MFKSRRKYYIVKIMYSSLCVYNKNMSRIYDFFLNIFIFVNIFISHTSTYSTIIIIMIIIIIIIII